MDSHQTRLFGRTAFSFALLALLATASGSLSLVTDRAGLLADDYIDWESFIPNGGGYVDSVGGGTTHDGNGYSVRGQIGNPNALAQVRHDLDAFYWEYPHDYAPADAFARTTGGSSNFEDGMVLDFSTPVSAVGSQVQSRMGTLFTVRIDTFAGNTLLGTFFVDSVRHGLVDGSAPFVGVSSSDKDITRAIYRVTNDDTNPNHAFAKNEVLLNKVSLRSAAPVPVPVPEPASLAALGIGVTSLVRRRWKRP